MKKHALALAALVAAPCFAQSSITLYGIVDLGLTHSSGSVTQRTAMTSGNNASSRFGFRGQEDLGGGLAASFWLETQFTADDGMGVATNTNNQPSGATTPGGITFSRRSTVSLSGTWGELRLGRDYTPQFWALTLMDPFAIVGVGANQVVGSIISGPTFARASNSLGYLLPQGLGGFYGQVQIYMGENASDARAGGLDISRDGTGGGLRLGYARGPVDVALAVGATSFATGVKRQSNLALAYDLGLARVTAMVEDDRAAVTGGPGATRARGGLVGAVVPVGPQEFKLSFSRYKAVTEGPALDPRQQKWALGYVYYLSKRTALYGTMAWLSNSGTTAATAKALGGAITGADRSSRGMDVGVRHTF